MIQHEYVEIWWIYRKQNWQFPGYLCTSPVCNIFPCDLCRYTVKATQQPMHLAGKSRSYYYKKGFMCPCSAQALNTSKELDLNFQSPALNILIETSFFTKNLFIFPSHLKPYSLDISGSPFLKIHGSIFLSFFFPVRVASSTFFSKRVLLPLLLLPKTSSSLLA